jgi:predicted nucleic acid-binding protein
VRIVTHPRVFHPASDLELALQFVEQVLGSPAARLLVPGTTYPTLFAEACRAGHAQGNLAFDAQIVAVCREHGVTEILTEGRDFTRFAVPVPLRLST